ncbi:hypothetical protein ColTof4_06940 [Colletotrichum tofieldiae]|nr:hypothetical protein ColTof3_11884 [Colletotrichum tofieldiae]GKT74517.1 hypothetical protein ColTof4_06940 [Colletotrichum tofieldiae]GKT91698.1 hypothetical protein Ct61P_09548 [Colletotrichum tofieldiae]
MCHIAQYSCPHCTFLTRVRLTHCNPVMDRGHVPNKTVYIDVIRNFCWSPMEGCRGLVFGSCVGNKSCENVDRRGRSQEQYDAPTEDDDSG